jgi:hypothetical protein
LIKIRSRYYGTLRAVARCIVYYYIC